MAALLKVSIPAASNSGQREALVGRQELNALAPPSSESRPHHPLAQTCLSIRLTPQTGGFNWHA
jgi:hypothetical protein